MPGARACRSHRSQTYADLIELIETYGLGILPKEFPFRIAKKPQGDSSPGEPNRVKLDRFLASRYLDPAVCFYTGEKLSWNVPPKGQHDPWMATVEHLRSRHEGGGNDVSNLRIASHLVNNMLSNAPLFVKIKVKKALEKFQISPEILPENKPQIYETFIRGFLAGFKLKGNYFYPWYWNTAQFKREERLPDLTKAEQAALWEEYLRLTELSNNISLEDL